MDTQLSPPQAAKQHCGPERSDRCARQHTIACAQLRPRPNRDRDCMGYAERPAVVKTIPQRRQATPAPEAIAVEHSPAFLLRNRQPVSHVFRTPPEAVWWGLGAAARSVTA